MDIVQGVIVIIRIHWTRNQLYATQTLDIVCVVLIGVGNTVANAESSLNNSVYEQTAIHITFDCVNRTRYDQWTQT